MDVGLILDDPVRRPNFRKRVNICRTDRERFKAIELLKAKNLECMRKFGSRGNGVQPFKCVSTDTTKIADIFCDKIGLPLETKMLTLEIYERFMVCLLSKILESHKSRPFDVCSSDIGGFKTVFQNECNTMPLYLIACIQVAAKFDNRDLPLLSPTETVDYLYKRTACKTTELDLMTAEMKVISCMDYELNFVTRYEAVEDLIATRKNNQFIQLSDEIFDKSVEILDMLYRNHRKIFDDFLLHMGINVTKAEKVFNKELQQAEYDAVWIAGATIVAATRLTSHKKFEEADFERLSQIILFELADDLSDIRSERELRTLSYVLFHAFAELEM
ncbi:Hypothetical predicted protein [Cloeon dipterum]|uniref:Cyclin N-terminal domain-containing protein n=1 Tax=Cloeon dipterum TaxID=197152 RepID=A0A8S1CGJ6_9INSE|nr:Hypothetical predicted protein [Cloeon dipterum]